MIELTFEQNLAILNFQEHVKTLSREEAQARLIQLYKDAIYLEALRAQQIGEQWGMIPPQ